ncbi:MAG: cytidylate kinase-like family protein [Coriobacteriia bacterium]|nr:cytidylate kinase-like family protein [Coriobacteriia bacterium]MBS5479260.1 cytidylate kinase-like family protein [Coriobacteriia bacterium]
MPHKNVVVTIGRQYGSGGREIGSTLACQLGVAYYDKKLVFLAAETSGYSTEAFLRQDEEVPRGLSWLFSYAPHGLLSEGGIPLDDQLFIAQANAIKHIAREHSCVIVGRCADYVLDDIRDEIDVVNVFVLSDEQARAERIARRNNLSLDKARARLKQISPRRANYYERYTDRKWADPHNFDLTINSAHLDAAGAADVIVSYLVGRGLITRDELPLDPAEPRDLGEEPLTSPAR